MWSLKKDLNSQVSAGKKMKAGIVCWAHKVQHCHKPYQNWPDNDWMTAQIQLSCITQQRKGTPTKEKWGQPPFHPTIIYFKTLLKFSFSPAPPPPSGVIKSAGSSAALSHTVLERHPPLLLPGAALWFKALILFKWQQRWAQSWRS